MENKYYCRYCGRELLKTSTGAENYYFESEAGKIYCENAYNKETGNRQIVYRYTCPKYKKSAWNDIFGQRHDDYMREEVYQELEFGRWEKI